MKGFKGFGKGFICRGKQYFENTVFEEEEARMCKCGMHFCKNPFDVLEYYGFVDEKGMFNEFAEVEALGDVRTDDEKKYCTNVLKIGAKLSFTEFVKDCISFVIKITSSKAEVSSGDRAQIGSSGDYAKIGNSGYYAQIGSSGDYTQIGSSGEYSVICCSGHGSVVKVKKGSWITLAEWEYSSEKKARIPKRVKTEFVDGKKIKADTWYKLTDGEFKEVEED